MCWNITLIKMQGAGNCAKIKIALAVVTGIGTGLGLALLTARRGWIFSRFCSSRKFPWNMKVEVAKNESQCITLVNELKRDIEISKVLGFDCEWVQIGDERNPVSLVQLATQGGLCGLFQIHLYSSVPEPLKELLENKEIVKVGIVPENDAKHLRKDYGIQVAGTLDIRYLLPVKGQDGVRAGGLANVVNNELGVQLPKDFSVRVSNWEADELSDDQKTYAALDALSSLMVFNKLIVEKVEFPFFSPKEDQWRQIHKYCSPLLDKSFKDTKKVYHQTSKNSSSYVLEKDKSRVPVKSSPNLEGKRSYKAFCPRKSPLYENAFMLAPDGVVLCTCDTKKAEWYVAKGLATVVDTVPLKIKLTFEPSGRVKGPSGKYYTMEKENQCVTCGRKDSYLRKKVVPHEYRKYFPDCMKKHQSHDILLLCAPCHASSNVSDFQLRLELATLCNAPLASDDNVKKQVTEDHKNKMIRSAARALLKSSQQLPTKRLKELTDFLKENCQQDVTHDLLTKLKDIDISVVNEEYTPHGLLVVEYFARDGVRGLMKLETIWREHFLNVMNPQHLPPLWSVDHYHEFDREYVLDQDYLDKLGKARLAN